MYTVNTNLCLTRLGTLLCLQLLFLSAGYAQIAPKQVALQIYIYDDLAIERRHEDLTENMFKKLQPEIEYRRVSIEGVQGNRTRRDVTRDLRTNLESALGDNEELRYLIVDTHGMTITGLSGEKITSLVGAGDVSESGVMSSFSTVFAPLKNKASDKLQIILNSCYSFCGGTESASLRARSLLEYFGAANGGVYGAETAEAFQLLDHPQFIKLKYLAPNLKRFLTISVVGSVLFSPLMVLTLMDELKEGVASSTSLLLPMLEGLAGSVAMGSLLGLSILPIYLYGHFAITQTYNNRGLYFFLEDGKLFVEAVPEKSKKVRNIISGKSSVKSCRKSL